MNNKVKAEILRSTYDSQYYCLNIEDKRHGIDAGPWKIVTELNINLEDISQYKSLQKQLELSNNCAEGIATNRDYFCGRINDVAKVIGMIGKDHFSPDAILRNVQTKIKELNKYREILEFYAEKMKYRNGRQQHIVLMDDEGKRAREILEK